jgi:hypothetical protein
MPEGLDRFDFVGRSKLWDRLLLISAALLVCAAGVGSGILGEIYHVNPAWFFFAWNSIFLLPLVGKKFRGYFKRPPFVAFFVAWMCAHGATVVSMIRWAPAVFWPFILLLELAFGFIIARWLFGLPLHERGSRTSQEY